MDCWNKAVENRKKKLTTEILAKEKGVCPFRPVTHSFDPKIRRFPYTVENDRPMMESLANYLSRASKIRKSRKDASCGDGKFLVGFNL
jgi:hypothetical protein